MSKVKAAFFDRDGTIIKDVNYLSSFDQIELIPGIIPLCYSLQSAGYRLFVVTNQSGVARGYFDELFVRNTHKKLKTILEKEFITFEKFYYCPHHPDKAIFDKYLKKCHCRKPEAGLLLQAAEEFNIDLSCSLMFGDKAVDIESGQKAGCKSFYIQEVLNKKGNYEW